MKAHLIALATVACFACGKPAPQQNVAPPAPTVVAPAPTPSVVEAPKPPAVHVELQVASVGNEMRFDKVTLTVPTGAEVHLVFKNNSTMTTMQHNWALVRPGTEASVALHGLNMGERAGYVDVRDHDLMTFTPQAKAGESTEVTFTAPEAGKYPYICTFPGHYMMMKGTLTVTP